MDYQNRVIEERAELSIKISKLSGFINSQNFSNLSETDKDLLRDQLRYMASYEEILDMRIERF